MEQAKEYRKVSELRNWDKNPRGIKQSDFDRLKTQIQKLGQYKPLLITIDGVVIGGNMRLAAYRELGIEDAWVSIVEPKDEKEMLEYALSDNDRAGYYEEQALAELFSNVPDFPFQDYSIDLGHQKPLNQFLKDYGVIQDGDDIAGLVADDKSKPIRLSITFQNLQDMENAKFEIEQIISNYQGAIISVGGGEL